MLNISDKIINVTVFKIQYKPTKTNVFLIQYTIQTHANITVYYFSYILCAY